MYLGKDKHGYSYYREIRQGLDYVYSYTPDGKCTGYISSWPAWQRTMHKLIVQQP